MVVDGDGELLLGGFLPNYVLIQELLHFKRFGDFIGSSRRGLDLIVLEYGVADRNALVADIGARIVAGRGDEFPNYVLTLMAKRTP
jgi:hypothetical protein